MLTGGDALERGAPEGVAVSANEALASVPGWLDAVVEDGFVPINEAWRVALSGGRARLGC